MWYKRKYMITISLKLTINGTVLTGLVLSHVFTWGKLWEVPCKLCNAFCPRPLLLSYTLTTLEHIIFHSIMEHLQINNVLIESQHGFRAGHSCLTQLISLVEDLLHVMDNQYQIDIILLDFTKAFDKVPHRCLLTKLLHYGIGGHTHKWNETWLTQWIQWVVIDGESSCSASVTYGIPQGTVLGPLSYVFNLR